MRIVSEGEMLLSERKKKQKKKKKKQEKYHQLFVTISLVESRKVRQTYWR